MRSSLSSRSSPLPALGENTYPRRRRSSSKQLSSLIALLVLAIPLWSNVLMAKAIAVSTNDRPSQPQASSLLAQTRSREDKITDAVYLNQNGWDYLNRGEAKQALAAFQEALVLFKENQVPAGEAESLTRIGVVYHYQYGQYDQALKFYNQALPLRRQAGDRQGEWGTLSYIGEVYADKGHPQQALGYYQQALMITQALKDRNGEKYRWLEVASMHFRLGQNSQALIAYQRALKLHRDDRDLEGEGTTLTNMGVVYANMGQYAQAIDHYQRALAIFESLPVFYGVSRAILLNNLSGVYFNIGEYKQALEYSQKATALFERFKRDGDFSWGAVGLLFDQPAQYAPTLEFRQLATRRGTVSAYGRQDSLDLGQLSALNNVGRILAGQGKYTEALKLHQEALETARNIANPMGEVVSLHNLGQVYSQQGQNDRAIQTYQQVLAIYRKLGDRTGEGIVLSNLGQAYENLNKFDEALKFYRQALAIHREVGDRPSEGIALSNIGRILHKSGKSAEAEKTLRDALKILESLRPGLRDKEKIAIFETQTRTYNALQQVLVSQKKVEDALEIAERGRARAFVELLTRKLDDRNNEQPTNDRLAGSSTNPSATASVATPPTLAQIKQVAKEQNATLVTYSVINDQLLFSWVVKPSGEVSFQPLDLKKLVGGGSKSSLTELVATGRTDIGLGSRGLVFQEDPTAVAVAVPLIEANGSALKDLYKLLIAPIATQLPTNPDAQVIIIPQADLFMVPFAALQRQDDRFLIEQHTLTIAPSIQVLQLTSQQRQELASTTGANGRSLRDVLIVGNPTMPKVGTPPEPLTSLPGAEAEAKTIGSLLGVTPLIGDRATKSAVLQRINTASIVHLATHGLLDDFGTEIPGAIALAPDMALPKAGQSSPGQTRGDTIVPPIITGVEGVNGFLTASEILDLKLKAELVVLSACDTGRGRITGDGVVGLSRSLVVAGVPSVVVSLWKVPDDSTAFLMKEFYRNLQQPNLNKAQALRQAMLISLKQYPDPKDWAAFALVGEAR